MDPDANLLEQREIVARMLKELAGPRYRTDNHKSILDDAERLAELVQALDEWLTRGGFLPSSWGTHWRGVRS